MSKFKRAVLAIFGEKGRSFWLFITMILSFTLIISTLFVSQGTNNIKDDIIASLNNAMAIVLDQESEYSYSEDAERIDRFNEALFSYAEKAGDYDFADDVMVAIYCPDNLLSTELEHPRISFYVDYTNYLRFTAIDDKDVSVFGSIIEPVLKDGRSFTQEEIDEGANVIVLDYRYTYPNGETVQVGDVIDFGLDLFSNSEDKYEGQNMIDHKDYQFEVIGTYNSEALSDNAWYSELLSGTASKLIHNSSYIPQKTFMKIADDYEKMYEKAISNDVKIADNGIINLNKYRIDSIIFKLNSIEGSDIISKEFEELRKTTLGDNYFVRVADSEYQELKGPLDNAASMALYIGVFGSVATLILIYLMIYLFISGQRKNLALFLAMGEKKKNTIMVLVLEVFLISLSALIVSFIASYFVKNAILSSLGSYDVSDINYLPIVVIAFMVLIICLVLTLIISSRSVSHKLRDLLM